MIGKTKIQRPWTGNPFPATALNPLVVLRLFVANSRRYTSSAFDIGVMIFIGPHILDNAISRLVPAVFSVFIKMNL
ncbi:MAG: hypothetical protein JXQ90_16475 [Cyclobacteriaceae bacterium]